MDRRALDKARSRFRVAKQSVAKLRGCNSFTEFSDNWYVFLVAWKNIYTILEQGVKTKAQSRQWFGSKKQERRGDALLQYLFEARNDEEHGLDNTLNLQPEKHDIGLAGDGASRVVRIDGGPFRNCISVGAGRAALSVEGEVPNDIRVTSLDGKPVKYRFTPQKIVLSPISARGRRTYNPPAEHLGDKIQDNSPIIVAAAAIDYMSSLLEEAERTLA